MQKWSNKWVVVCSMLIVDGQLQVLHFELWRLHCVAAFTALRYPVIVARVHVFLSIRHFPVIIIYLYISTDNVVIQRLVLLYEFFQITISLLDL